jgi:DNA polymerase I-like protein with 3'-5' exonuclease and polymerase domains
MLIILDFSQIELRIAVVLAGDKVMLEAFLRGEDLHILTASRVLRRPSAEVTKNDRQTAKAVNFGLVYGQRGAGLCTYARTNYGVTLTPEQDEELRTRFFNTYAGLAEWHRKAWLRAPFVLESRTLLGRRRLARPDDTDWARWQLLINHSVQGTGADGLKRALVRLFCELPSDTRLIACVHDEVILETSAQRAEQVKHWAKEAMMQEMSRLVAGVPIEVEAKIVQDWGQK